MVSKSQIKLITSLQQKKYRNRTGLFVAEGPKVIAELIKNDFEIHSLFTTDHPPKTTESVFKVTQAELQKLSFLKTAHHSLAVFHIPKIQHHTPKGLVLALDGVRDPGNLGTIIRLCDWFGIDQLVCSLDSADAYNPKVVQASMGSLGRVKVLYTDLTVYLEDTSLPVYATVMDGNNVYQESLPKEAVIVMGNEGQGISEAILQQVTARICIPQFGMQQETESLNVATATAIFLSEFRRSTER